MAVADRAKVTVIVQDALLEVPPETVGDYVSRAEEYFLANAYRANVPARATYLWADIAILISKNGFDTSGQQTVSSIKRGDTTVNYESTASGLSGITSRIALYKVAKIR